MTLPELAVITISYNQGAFLKTAIKSVLNSGVDVEYVLVDPGSRDDSRDIIRNYQPHLAHAILEPDNGPADGLNKGIHSTTSAIVGCINADDYYLDGALSQVVTVFRRCPDVDVLTGHGLITDEYGHPVRRLHSTNFSPLLYARGASLTVQQATFFRREAFERAGGFNVSNGVSWDAELLIDMALSGSTFRRVNAYWGAFRFHVGSITASGKLRQQYLAEQKRLLAKVLGRSPNRGDLALHRVGRVHKWLRHPTDTVLRVSDALRAGRSGVFSLVETGAGRDV